MLKELSEDLNSTKKIQSETRGTLIKLKSTLQGTKSRVDVTKNHIFFIQSSIEGHFVCLHVSATMRTCTDISLKKTYKWPTDIRKDVQLH